MKAQEFLACLKRYFHRWLKLLDEGPIRIR